MAIPQRMRFEVLRRDKHTCRYCGAQAPDAKMTVDHVVPSSLGGADDPSNLVAACHDCNAGKASTGPAEETVAQVSEEAQRWASAISQAQQEMLADRQAALDEVAPFDEAWRGWKIDGRDLPRPSNWPDSIRAMMRSGLPTEKIVDLVGVAMGAKKVRTGDVFRYFCGCCWKAVRDIQDRAEAIASEGQRTVYDHASEVQFASERNEDYRDAHFDDWESFQMDDID